MRRFYDHDDRWEVWSIDQLRHRELVALESVWPRLMARVPTLGSFLVITATLTDAP